MLTKYGTILATEKINYNKVYFVMLIKSDEVVWNLGWQNPLQMVAFNVHYV